MCLQDHTFKNPKHDLYTLEYVFGRQTIYFSWENPGGTVLWTRPKNNPGAAFTAVVDGGEGGGLKINPPRTQMVVYATDWRH